MDLREYLFYNNINIKQFADKIEYSRSYVSLIAHGKHIPTKRMAKVIEEATNGEVKMAYKEARKKK